MKPKAWPCPRNSGVSEGRLSLEPALGLGSSSAGSLPGSSEASSFSPVLPQLPSQVPPTQARVWPLFFFLSRDEKQKSSGQRQLGRGEMGGEGRAANRGRGSCQYFLLCLLSGPLSLPVTAKTA